VIVCVRVETLLTGAREIVRPPVLQLLAHGGRRRLPLVRKRTDEMARGCLLHFGGLLTGEPCGWLALLHHRKVHIVCGLECGERWGEKKEEEKEMKEKRRRRRTRRKREGEGKEKEKEEEKKAMIR
jgi:hypothetical protein